MTGALFEDIWNAAAYSASVAPSRKSAILYWILGILAAVAYKLGNRFPLYGRQNSASIQSLSIAPSQTISSTQPYPLFVVIPAFIRTVRELSHVQLAVDKILQSPNTGSVQIILVDDASPSIIHLTGCTVVRHPTNLGPAAARNTGVTRALASGATSIAFTDTDCLPAWDWVSAHARLQNSSPGIWAGLTLAYDHDLISQFQNDVGTLMPRLKDSFCVEALYAPTCNLSISASIASDIRFDSGFPTSAFEDCDFCVRAGRFGHKVNISSSPIVQHRFKGTMYGLLQSYFKYGRSYPIMLQKHPNYKSMLASSRPMSIEAWRSVG